MTRKTALQKAISLLSADKKNTEICEKLSDILEDMPLINWTDKTIRDRIEQFYEDEGRYPTTTDFKKKGMPPHPVFKHRYKVNLSQWLQENYHVPKITYEERKEKHTKAFMEEYLRLRPTSSDDFDRRRQKGIISWRGLAPYYNVTSWHSLLNALNLPHPQPEQKKRVKQKFNVKVYTDLDFEAMIEPRRKYY